MIIPYLVLIMSIFIIGLVWLKNNKPAEKVLNIIITVMALIMAISAIIVIFKK